MKFSYLRDLKYFSNIYLTKINLFNLQSLTSLTIYQSINSGCLLNHSSSKLFNNNLCTTLNLNTRLTITRINFKFKLSLLVWMVYHVKNQICRLNYGWQKIKQLEILDIIVWDNTSNFILKLLIIREFIFLKM